MHTPVGLYIGARTAPEIALSILAAVVRERRLGGGATATAAAAPADAHCCPS